MSDLYPICKHGNGMYRPSARRQTTVYFAESLYTSHVVSYLYYAHFPLFYQSKLKTTQKSHKKEPEVHKIQTSQSVQTSLNQPKSQILFEKGAHCWTLL